MRGNAGATRRASSVRARAAIQDALSTKMRTLHVNDSISGRIETLDRCPTLSITPDNNDDDDQCINDSADDEDYNPAHVASPPPKSWPKMVVRNKTANRS